MKKLPKIIIGIAASLCLWAIPTAQPVEASQTPLTVNIPDGKQAEISNKAIKINLEDDGTVTFEGKTEANAEVTIAKRGGNNRHYKVDADENGNFSKTLRLSTKTKKCNFDITAEDDDDSKSTNKAYVKPVVESESSSSSNSSVEEEAASAVSSSSTSTSATNDMKTDQANGMIVGNANSKIYHTPDQQGYHMNPANAVYFNTEAEAQAAGYRKSLR